jgi:hypothetical protein
MQRLIDPALCPFATGDKVTLPQEGQQPAAVTGTVSIYMPLPDGNWRVWLQTECGMRPCIAQGVRPSAV